jgi:hypothetical protein
MVARVNERPPGDIEQPAGGEAPSQTSALSRLEKEWKLRVQRW